MCVTDCFVYFSHLFETHCHLLMVKIYYLEPILGRDHQHQKLMMFFWPTTQRCSTDPDNKLYIYLLILRSKGSKCFIHKFDMAVV